LVHKNLWKRGVTYEVIVFVYATLWTWLIIGNPLKSLFLSVVITMAKIPLYYIFHRTWRAK